MSAELVGAIVNSAIPFFEGVCCWLVGSRRLGKPPGQDPKLDDWHARFGKLLFLLGPLLMLFGVFLFVAGLFRPH